MRFPTRKLERIDTVGGPGAIAIAGSAELGLFIIDLWKRDRLVEEWPMEQQKGAEWVILVVAMPRKPVIYYERLPVAQTVYGDFHAWGGGLESALGAMAAGATAVRAVEIANCLDNTCGLGVDYVDVPR